MIVNKNECIIANERFEIEDFLLYDFIMFTLEEIEEESSKYGQECEIDFEEYLANNIREYIENRENEYEIEVA